MEVPMEYIDPNPWQPREQENRQHVWEVAQSIAERGLMQSPAGRLVIDGQPAGRDLYDYDNFGSILAESGSARVQLAFGHTRCAAFRMLSEQGDAKYRSMPVILRDLSDVEMFEQGLDENISRNNLNPIERAKAMKRYRDEFNKTSEEIGKLFHMGDSGVRNCMRLLKLPADLQDSLRRGEMAEGTARELLPVVELPEDVRLAAEDDDDFVKPSEIIEAAKSGGSQKAISEMVAKFMERIGKRQAKPAAQPPAPAPTYNPAPAPQPAPAFQPSQPAPAAPAWQPQGERTAPAPAAQPAPTSGGQVYPSETTVTTPSGQVVNASTGEVVTPAEPFADEANPPAAQDPQAAWAAATVTLTLTYWPEDGNPDGRMVMVGARAGQGTPLMRMFREQTLNVSETVPDLLEELKSKLGGA